MDHIAPYVDKKEFSSVFIADFAGKNFMLQLPL